MKILLILTSVLVLNGCATQNYKSVIQGANAYRYATGGSFSRAGLNEQMRNCLKDAFDPSNRGSRC
jgi:hypothetical protein